MAAGSSPVFDTVGMIAMEAALAGPDLCYIRFKILVADGTIVAGNSG